MHFFFQNKNFYLFVFFKVKMVGLKSLLLEKKEMDFDEFEQVTYRDAQPIFVDCGRKSYWLLPSQESFSVFPLDSNAKSFNKERAPVTEPCILVRTSLGTWHYHDGIDYSAFLNYVESRNQAAALRITERISAARTIFKFAKNQPQNKIWLDRKLAVEKWTSAATLYSGPSEALRCRQLEAHFARCLEARMCIYYANIYQRGSREGDKEYSSAVQRRCKEYFRNEILPVPPVSECSDGLKRLSCTLTATRIHSDQTICSFAVSQLARTDTLRKFKSSFPVGDDDNQDNQDSTVPQTASLAHNSLVEHYFENTDSYYKFQTLTEYIEMKRKERPSTAGKSKAILQINLSTGDVLRVFASGKEAAQFLNVSQSGISLCLNGLKQDSYGFKWKLYEGNPIECNEFLSFVRMFIFYNSLDEKIHHLQMPLHEVRSLQLMRGKPVANEGEYSHKIPEESLNIPPETVKAAENVFAFPLSVQYRSQAHIISSTKTTSSKMVKLKSDIFNILFSFPEKALKWPELDLASEQLIHSAGEAAANNVIPANIFLIVFTFS
jgi:hypothetical protein